MFHPDRMASRILDMGDVLTLIEQAERAFDAEQAQRMADKVARGDAFTLEEFLEQMQAVKKMGSLGKLLGMLPGMAEARKQLEQIDDRELDRVAAIMGDISRATTEQASGIGQVKEAAMQLDRATQENAAFAEKVTAASVLLTHQADTLLEAVSIFNVSTE